MPSNTLPCPTDTPSRPQGEVVLFVGGPEATDAALAYLMQTANPGARSLLVDAAASDERANSAFRLGDRGVWRAGRPRSDRLRDWVLFLQECRAGYDTTALSAQQGDGKQRAWLLQAADRVMLVAQPGERAVADSLLEMHRLRRAGAARCECLLLDAA